MGFWTRVRFPPNPRKKGLSFFEKTTQNESPFFNSLGNRNFLWVKNPSGDTHSRARNYVAEATAPGARVLQARLFFILLTFIVSPFGLIREKSPGGHSKSVHGLKDDRNNCRMVHELRAFLQFFHIQGCSRVSRSEINSWIY